MIVSGDIVGRCVGDSVGDIVGDLSVDIDGPMVGVVEAYEDENVVAMDGLAVVVGAHVVGCNDGK